MNRLVRTCRGSSCTIVTGTAIPRPVPRQLAFEVANRRLISTLKRKAREHELDSDEPVEDEVAESDFFPDSWVSVVNHSRRQREERTKRVFEETARVVSEVDARGSKFVRVNRKTWIPEESVHKWLKSILSSGNSTPLSAALVRRTECEQKIFGLLNLPYEQKHGQEQSLVQKTHKYQGKQLVFAALRVAREIEGRTPFVASKQEHLRRLLRRVKEELLSETDIHLLERLVRKRRIAEQGLVTILGEKSFLAKAVHQEQEERERTTLPGETDIDVDDMIDPNPNEDMIPIPESSACVVLISPQNEVLLVQRVKNASTFPSAHVFPGGKHDDDQDGRMQKGNSDHYRDSKEFRRCALRELFEETGILLAKDGETGKYVELDIIAREEGRQWLRKSSITFQPWIKTICKTAWPDLDNLYPFSRWTTPPGGRKRRFRTQMYLYFLPFNDDSAVKTDDGKRIGLLPNRKLKYRLISFDKNGRSQTADPEIISAEFAKPSKWLERAAKNEISLYPPQFVLLNILKTCLEQPPSCYEHNFTPSDETNATPLQLLEIRRQNLMAYIRNPPPEGEMSKIFPPEVDTTIPWAYKNISPYALKKVQREVVDPSGQPRIVEKAVLGLDHPGPEASGRDRYTGDVDNVVLARFTTAGPRDLEYLPRSQFMTVSEEKQCVMKRGSTQRRALIRELRNRRLRNFLVSRIRSLDHRARLKPNTQQQFDEMVSELQEQYPGGVLEGGIRELRERFEQNLKVKAELRRELIECGLIDESDERQDFSGVVKNIEGSLTPKNTGKRGPQNLSRPAASLSLSPASSSGHYHNRRGQGRRSPWVTKDGSFVEADTFAGIRARRSESPDDLDSDIDLEHESDNYLGADETDAEDEEDPFLREERELARLLIATRETKSTAKTRKGKSSTPTSKLREFEPFVTGPGNGMSPTEAGAEAATEKVSGAEESIHGPTDQGSRGKRDDDKIRSKL